MKPVWLHSARFDTLFFLAPGVLGLGLGALVIGLPGLLVPLLWAWMLLIEGPHLLATLQRTVFDPRFRAHHPDVLWVTAGIGVLPLLWWAVTEVVNPSWGLVLLAVAGVASVHHGIRQHYGIVALYDAKSGATPAQRRWGWWALHGTLWAWMVASQLLVPVNRVVLELPPVAWDAATAGGLVALFFGVAGLGALGWRVVWGLREGAAMGGLVALGPVALVVGFNALGVAWAEPVLANAPTPEQQLLAVTLVGGVMHGLQYLGVVALANPGRFAEASGWSGVLGRRASMAYAAAVGVSVGYLFLNAARSAHPGWSLFAAEAMPARFFVALYWAVFFHHYALDARIWRVGRDPQLRMEMGL